jgi:hypothetical protein
MRYKEIKIKIILMLVIVGVIFCPIIFIIVLYPSNNRTLRILDRDGRRRHGLIQLQIALNLYADENAALYPPLPPMCSSVDILKSYFPNRYSIIIPEDPLISNGHPNFEIAISLDRKEYVLRAILEGNNSIADLVLKNDIDGFVLGCNCNDPSFCVMELANK